MSVGVPQPNVSLIRDVSQYFFTFWFKHTATIKETQQRRGSGPLLHFIETSNLFFYACKPDLKSKKLKTLILTQIFFILNWNWAWSLEFKKFRTASSTSVVIFLCWKSSIWALWIQCQALTVPHSGSDQLALCSFMTETHQSRLKHFQLPQAPDFPAKYALTQMVPLNFLLRYTAWALEIIIKSCFSCSLEKVKVCC